MQFQSEELDELECFEFELDEHDDTLSSDAGLVKQLCLPFSTLELSLPDDELLKLDLVTSSLISWKSNVSGTWEFEHGSSDPVQ